MISRYRYILSSIAVVIVFIFFFIKALLPLANSVGVRFFETVNEMKTLHQVGENHVVTDSLLEEYRVTLKQMDAFLGTNKSASDILKLLLDLSQQHQLVLLDLSTQEPESKTHSTEYPVVFQALGEFPKIHRFLTDVENSDLCIKVSTIRMEREDTGRAKASVELSVFVREPLP
jgi:Tfp pilus assembly protein PilO